MLNYFSNKTAKIQKTLCSAGALNVIQFISSHFLKEVLLILQ